MKAGLEIGFRVDTLDSKDVCHQYFGGRIIEDVGQENYSLDYGGHQMVKHFIDGEAHGIALRKQNFSLLFTHSYKTIVYLRYKVTQIPVAS